MPELGEFLVLPEILDHESNELSASDCAFSPRRAQERCDLLAPDRQHAIARDQPARASDITS